MSEEFTQETGDASSVESTASSESSSSSETQGAAQSQEAASSVDKSPPFHEHPRFQELIEQNRAYRQQMDEHSRKVNEMRDQMGAMQKAQQTSQQPNKPNYSPLLERLKTIDPEFTGMQSEVAKLLDSFPQMQEQFQQFQNWQSQMELEKAQSTATSTLDKLYTQFKVPSEQREDYEVRIKAMAYENPKLGVKDLENVFKQTHDALSKRFDAWKRQERASYVDSKTKDKVPTTQTGGSPAKIPGPSKTTFEDRVAMVTKALKEGKQV